MWNKSPALRCSYTCSVICYYLFLFAAEYILHAGYNEKNDYGGIFLRADKLLRPPIHRSWLRLRLGEAYYAGKRYLLWCSLRFHWARTCKKELLPCIQSTHATLLLRQLRGEGMEL